MAQCIFFISIVVITLSSASCDSSDISNFGIQRIEADNPCIFGPFKHTAMGCLLRDRMFTGCILQGLNWFNATNKLHMAHVVWPFLKYVIQRKDEVGVMKFVESCVNEANRGGNTREEVGNIFVKCLDENNGFIDVFPDAFCESEKDAKKNA